ncbi:cytochrome bc complex cytochrome b subunit [Fodinicola feengrottensis]|uniref:Cytochrome bc1 complex cytochrome b subunit n=1 Tax=Fodinicola feengrottensis TaxID=435914 RepID=A0ABN2IFE2_9ACTN
MISLPKINPAEIPEQAASWADDRFAAASPVRKLMNKVFPDHWSFMLGEIALYSFIVLLLSGTFLALYFEPSALEVKYAGSYTPLYGIEMSRAYETTLNLSFDVRGGLIMRQIHHWAALLFMAAMVVHMLRVFFTGAFRRPREINWVVGALLFIMGFFEGFAGYSLPDDAISGTGLRVMSAIMQSTPVIGTWFTFSVFGGEYPGTEILPRLYIAHVLLLPGLILGLIAVHMGLLVKQKHTQYPGPGRTEKNVVGVRMVPNFSAKAGGFFMVVFGMIAFLGGVFQINPVWIFGPYTAAVVSAGTTPDWYVAWSDGALRLFPDWEIYIGPYTIPAMFWPSAFLMGAVFSMLIGYPFLEARLTKDSAHHNLLQRPRDAPARTALGAMAIAFIIVLLMSAGNDIIAEKFDISLNAMTWIGRIGLLLAPPIAYYITYRLCLGAQQGDRITLAHGVETGIIRRLPNGEFIEIHQPLGPADSHGHSELEYSGWAVPKKMNRLGALGNAAKGFFVPLEKPGEAPVSPAPVDQRELTRSDD